jgi:hypothetical protein
VSRHGAGGGHGGCREGCWCCWCVDVESRGGETQGREETRPRRIDSDEVRECDDGDLRTYFLNHLPCSLDYLHTSLYCMHCTVF